jgi:hypothetical protein
MAYACHLRSLERLHYRVELTGLFNTRNHSTTTLSDMVVCLFMIYLMTFQYRK